MDREELGKGDPQGNGLQKTFYEFGLPLGYLCLDLMLLRAPITLNTEHIDTAQVPDWPMDDAHERQI